MDLRKVLGRKRIAKVALKLFDKTVWIWRRVDGLMPWRGLSLIVDRAGGVILLVRRPTGRRSPLAVRCLIDSSWPIRVVLTTRGGGRRASSRREALASPHVSGAKASRGLSPPLLAVHAGPIFSISTVSPHFSALTDESIFRTRPHSTPPAPHSMNRVTPFESSRRIDSVQRTGFGT